MHRIVAGLAAIISISLAEQVHAQTGEASAWVSRATMPSSDLMWGSIAVVDDNPCCENLRNAPLEARSDAPILETVRERAFRSGIMLSLKLDANRSMKIIDCDNQWICGVSGSRRHDLAAWWPKHRYYVVDVALWEGRQTYLISEHDGQASLVFAPPVLSPSGRYGIASDLSPAYGKGLQLIDMSASPPTMLEVKSMPACLGTKHQYSLRPTPIWTDDSHVRFEGKSFFDNDDPDAKQVLYIVGGKPVWEC